MAMGAIETRRTNAGAFVLIETRTARADAGTGEFLEEGAGAGDLVELGVAGGAAGAGGACRLYNRSTQNTAVAAIVDGGACCKAEQRQPDCDD